MGELLPALCGQTRLSKGSTCPLADALDWAKRRHPNKSSKWVKARYFRNDGYWTFWEGKAELVKPDATPITRFTKVTGRHSPYAPALRPYWTERKKQPVGRETDEKQRLLLHQNRDTDALCVTSHSSWEQA